MEQALITTITVLGREVKVLIVPQSVVDERVSAPGFDTQGVFDCRTAEILLSAELGQEQLRRVLMHEISHAILSYSGLGNVLGSEKREEAICDAFETILDLFRDEKLLKFLKQS